MKNLIWTLILVISSVSVCKAQKVFSVEHENQADVKVFVVDYENQADLKVYKVKYENQAGQNNGKWFFTKYATRPKRKSIL
jgi:hypothetical protein